MRQTVKFDYYYGMQAEAYSFYRIPKMLFTSPHFKDLSCEAKVLYGLMLDRMSLSIKNKWFDEQSRVYIIFTIEEVKELMNCCHQTAVRLTALYNAPITISHYYTALVNHDMYGGGG